MNIKNEKDDLRQYRLGGLTVLQLMPTLAIVGLLSAWILRHFFAA